MESLELAVLTMEGSQSEAEDLIEAQDDFCQAAVSLSSYVACELMQLAFSIEIPSVLRRN